MSLNMDNSGLYRIVQDNDHFDGYAVTEGYDIRDLPDESKILLNSVGLGKLYVQNQRRRWTITNLNKEAPKKITEAEFVRTFGGKEKETDWAVMGGLANGLGGIGAGIATAANAQVHNAGVRARNAAADRGAAETYQLMQALGITGRGSGKSRLNDAQVRMWDADFSTDTDALFTRLQLSLTRGYNPDNGGCQTWLLTGKRTDQSMDEYRIDGSVVARGYQCKKGSRHLVAQYAVPLPLLGIGGGKYTASTELILPAKTPRVDTWEFEPLALWELHLVHSYDKCRRAVLTEYKETIDDLQLHLQAPEKLVAQNTERLEAQRAGAEQARENIQLLAMQKKKGKKKFGLCLILLVVVAIAGYIIFGIPAQTFKRGTSALYMGHERQARQEFASLSPRWQERIVEECWSCSQKYMVLVPAGGKAPADVREDRIVYEETIGRQQQETIQSIDTIRYLRGPADEENVFTLLVTFETDPQRRSDAAASHTYCMLQTAWDLGFERADTVLDKLIDTLAGWYEQGMIEAGTVERCAKMIADYHLTFPWGLLKINPEMHAAQLLRTTGLTSDTAKALLAEWEGIPMGYEQAKLDLSQGKIDQAHAWFSDHIVYQQSYELKCLAEKLKKVLGTWCSEDGTTLTIAQAGGEDPFAIKVQLNDGEEMDYYLKESVNEFYIRTDGDYPYHIVSEWTYETGYYITVKNLDTDVTITLTPVQTDSE